MDRTGLLPDTVRKLTYFITSDIGLNPYLGSDGIIDFTLPKTAKDVRYIRASFYTYGERGNIRISAPELNVVPSLYATNTPVIGFSGAEGLGYSGGVINTNRIDLYQPVELSFPTTMKNIKLLLEGTNDTTPGVYIPFVFGSQIHKARSYCVLELWL